MRPREQMTRSIETFLLCRKAEEHPGGRLPRLLERPSVTISRQAGTRSFEIAKHLEDYLTQFDESAEHGWALIDKGVLAGVIENHHLPEKLPEPLIPFERGPTPHPVVQRIQDTPPSEWTLFQHSADAIRRLCRLGNVVVLGRGGNFLTHDLSNVFHVRLVGEVSHRSRQVEQALRLSPSEALAYLESTDRARSAYVERHLDRSISDPASYHLTLNLDRISPITAAHIIGDALIEWAGERALPVHA